ncbi:MAG: NAD(P)-binding domain-containing protein, partial [Deltaproteobacteria bacterium]|nr:NAD(P)-binding domain-containing protein [Deltaproteobacteria bacterium]
MSVEHTIAFIGAGNMAGALIRGLISTGTVSSDRIIAADPDEARLRSLEAELEIGVTGDNAEAVKKATVVVLATKPQVLPQVLCGLATAMGPDTRVISIAAGISTGMIERAFSDGSRVVRTMPNTPALVGAGATAIAAGSHATDDDLGLA